MKPTVCIEPTDVACSHQRAGSLPVAPVGVAEELRRAGEVNPARSTSGRRHAVVIENRERDPVGRAADGAGGGAQVGGICDGPDGRLGGAIDVVEVVAEAVHPFSSEFAREDVPAAEHHAGPAHRCGVDRQVQNAAQHQRHHHECVVAALAEQLADLGGLEPLPDFDGAGGGQPDDQLAETPGVKERRRDEVAVAEAVRDAPHHAGSADASRLQRAHGALGGAGRARRQQDELRSARRGRAPQFLGGDRRHGTGIASVGHEHLRDRARLGDDLGEFLVGHDDSDAVALADFGQVRCRQRRRQQHCVTAGPFGRDQCSHEPPVVATQDADSSQASIGPGCRSTHTDGHAGCGTVQRAVIDRAFVVDDGGAAAEPERCCGHGRRGAEAPAHRCPPAC